MKSYSLIGIDGNAFSVMGYVQKALRETGNAELIAEYSEKAKSGDYANLICISDNYLDIANGKAREIVKSEEVDWGYYDKFQNITDKYLQDVGQGDNMATQAVTAMTKLVYKYYNDGDVFDNSNLYGGCNDLSSYANWLYENVLDDKMKSVAKEMVAWYDELKYQYGLKLLADFVFDEKLLCELEKKSVSDDIYKCEGPFEYREEYDDYEDDYEEDDEDE